MGLDLRVSLGDNGHNATMGGMTVHLWRMTSGGYTSRGTDCMGKVLKDTDYLVYPTGKRQERHMAGKGVNIELFLVWLWLELVINLADCYYGWSRWSLCKKLLFVSYSDSIFSYFFLPKKFIANFSRIHIVPILSHYVGGLINYVMSLICYALSLSGKLGLMLSWI